jgi:hypothetical protein
MRSCVLSVLLLAVSTVGVASASAPVPSNIELLGRVTEQAVEQALKGAPLDGRASVVIQAADRNKGNWFIEEYLIPALRRRGITVLAGQGVPPLPASADSAAGDSAAGGDAGSAPASLVGEPMPVTGSIAQASHSNGSANGAALPVLEYRILDLSLAYTGARRWMAVGAKSVDRDAAASLHARLLDGTTHEILWVGSGDARASDRIPGDLLREVGASSYPCDPPRLNSRGLGRFVEPVVVTAIVTGLVYLFYTNQN